MHNVTERTAWIDASRDDYLAWSLLFGPDEDAKKAAYGTMIHERMMKQLVDAGHPMGAMMNHAPVDPMKCVKEEVIECVAGKYRSYSGHCNNVMKPNWGAAIEPMRRLLPALYDDDLSAPHSISIDGSSLPTPTSVSSLFFSHSVAPSSSPVSLLFVQWASFIYDDIAAPLPDHIANGRAAPLPCCRTGFEHPECIAIAKNETTCLPYVRTMPAVVDRCVMGRREQINVQSSYLDASHIYGVTRERAQRLRAYKDGLLEMDDLTYPLSLPRTRSDLRCRNGDCFDGGNGRMNLLPSSAALHTLWMRHHNNLARELKVVNPHWSDEIVYQEARRIVIAQIQHITYSSFLPILLGREAMSRYDLIPRSFGFDSSYDMKLEPTTLNEFAAATGLFFSSLVPQQLGTVSVNGSVARERSIADAFGDPSLLRFADGLEGTIRYLLHNPAPSTGLRMSSSLLGRALGGVDAAAWIIQMGRDHGLPNYGEWRDVCGLPTANHYEDIEFREGVDLTRLRFHYANPADMDLFLAGLAEKPVAGALLGPTFSCILARQFSTIKRGDRFWYENFVFPSAFSDEQLKEMRKTSLSSILCETTGDKLGTIQMDPLMAQDPYTNAPMPCNSSNLLKMDLTVWKDVEQNKKFPITRELLEKALKMGQEQFLRLQEAEGKRITENGGILSSGRSSAFSHSSLLAPKLESLDIAVTAGVLRETTKILVSGNFSLSDAGIPPNLEMSTLQMLLPEIDLSEVIGNFKPFLTYDKSENRSNCLPQALPCDHTNKFRSASGWCNNIRFPHYGNSFQPMRRLLPPAYDDGFDTPRTRAKSGRQLPSARRVSNKIHHDQPIFHTKFTHLLMQYGQILDHDMMHSPIARGAEEKVLNCTRCDSHESLSVHCFPIPIDHDDPHFPAFHSDGSRRCMPFTRSLLGQVKLGYRNQLNQLSSFLDASTIYGSTDCEMRRLRLFKQGKLNFTDLGFNREALPQGQQERDCRLLPAKMCFVAGDERNNEQPGLTVLHTIFMREHNRVAVQLGKINPSWNDEHIFQETRRIMMAKLQHITYNEWLPIVLGWETMEKYELTPTRNGYFNGYDAHCDASISQEMSTSAFRFGHSLVRNVLPRMNSSMQNDTIGIEMKNSFNNPFGVYERQHGHIESILMGLVGSGGMAFDRHVVAALRNHLFQKPGGPLTGLDLPAVNIQRARDHGVPAYNNYRELCGLKRARNFFDLAEAMDGDAIRAFSETYESVDDIDLFPGIMSERPRKGSLVGPTLGCLIGEQMQRLKKCDRFFYESDVESVRFTEAQLSEIRQTSMAKMLCANSYWAAKIQPNVFLMPDELTNAPVSCEDLPAMDFKEWSDRESCTVDNYMIPLGATKRVTPCMSCTCTAQGTECHAMTVQNCDSLMKDFPEEQVKRDSVCVVQCAEQMKKKLVRRARSSQ
ncbi:hypothetical protein PENTCL1PPCAC_17112 [Pristionchus entomophagus]|uniref:peroxidase n=1 Tax=Pristionchus entomophagus TaxID=358040 RepID=A0AAV5TL77_9BILA|nr:hypothetical protein PENTCL1PPCAC_17112 [Pristionchus entomophagus]